MRRLTCLLITAAAVLACAPAAHAQTVTPPAACPGTFQVLHNDTIGTLSLKAGAYTITVQNPSVLSCATASSLLTRFLMWGMLFSVAVYIPIALLALDRGWGIVGVWSGLAALIVVRLATCGARFASERWAVTGALRA